MAMTEKNEIKNTRQKQRERENVRQRQCNKRTTIVLWTNEYEKKQSNEEIAITSYRALQPFYILCV